MKNFKKILSGVLVASAMASCLAIPTYADVVYNDLPTTVSENGLISYQLPNDFTIQSVLDDKDQALVLNGQRFIFYKLYVHDNSEDFIPGFDTEVDNTIDYTYDFIMDDGRDFVSGEIIDSPTAFYYILNDIENHPESEVTNKEIVEVPLNISPEPDNKDDLTIGNSNPTGVRGDINYDGKVTTADLLLLKKYLLGIVKW